MATQMSETLRFTDEKKRIAKAKEGDNQALSELIEMHLSLISCMSNRFRELFFVVSKEELIQAGIVGFLSALGRYSEKKGVLLRTYAVPWILGEMRLALSKSIESMGSYYDRKRIEKAVEDLQIQLNRSPTLQEISVQSGMNVFQVARITALEIETLDDENKYGRSIREELLSVESRREECELRIAIDSLQEEEQQLIFLRYFRDKTQKETACLLGKSQAQVSRIERRVLEKLRLLLRE